jgi:hypothetical protein
LLCFCFTQIVIYAQVENAEIAGTVRDSSGAFVPGVQITVTHVQTNRKFSTITNDQGRYTAVALPLGNYQVEAELPGFKKAVRTGITLQVQETAVVDLTLEVGEVTEQVEVRGDAPLLNTTEPSQGQVIENRRIVDMPLNGRDYAQLALLSAGAVEPIGGRAGGFSSGGQRTTQNNYLLDGVDNNSVELATAGRRAEMVKPSIDAIQEFKVQTNSYSAEFGHGTGAVINVTTKSGSNEIHGSAFEFIRNEVLDARNFFDLPNTPKPPFKRNQFGFSIGGPVVKNKTFFFGDYEGTRFRESRTVVSTVPTLKMRSGDLSEISNVIYDPATYDPATKARQPFAGNLIPANRLDPIARTLIGLYPNPQNNSLSSNFVFNPPNKEDVDKYDIRLDHGFSGSDNIYYRLSFHDQTLPASLNLPAPAFGAGVFDSTIRGWNTGLVWNHTFSPTLISSNRIAWNYTRFTRVNPAEAGKENLNSKYGLKGVDLATAGAFSQFTIAGYRNLGLGSFNGVDRDSQNRQFASDTTWIRGNQTIKIGANILRSQNNIFNIRDFVGNFNFNGGFSNNPATGKGGDAVADFLLGIPSRFVRSTAIDVNLRGWLYGFYLQDDWHVRPGLTVNLGARYELALPYLDRNNRMAQFDMDTDPQNPKLVPATSGSNASRALIAADPNNIAPRIGFAYQILPRIVIRGGYGIFFGYMEPSGDAEYLIGNPPFAFGSQINTDSITPALLLKDGAPPDLLTVAKATNLSFSSFERNPSRDYAQQWNLNVQHQWKNDWLFEIGYYGEKGTHLLRRIFGNPSPPGAGNIDGKRRYKQIAIPGTNVVVSPLGPVLRHEWDGNSIFHSMQTRVEKRFASGFTLLTSYIWSRTIGDSCGFAGSGNAPGCDYQDPNNLRLERGLDNEHMAHRFVLSSIWELPFGQGRRWASGWNSVADAFLGGWSVADIITIESGQPMTATTQGDPANTGETNRPNLVGDPLLPRGQRTVERWFNKEAFVANGRYTFGNAGRNILLQPGVGNIDFATFKRFRITERVATQFRFEAFNFFNTPHLGAPNAQVGNRNFGRITSAGRPRTLQFGLKVVF